MEVVKYIVLAIYAIVCIGLIILTTIQTSDDKGVSDFLFADVKFGR